MKHNLKVFGITILILLFMVLMGLFYYAFFLIVLILTATIFGKLAVVAKEEYKKAELESNEVREKRTSSYYRNKRYKAEGRGEEWWDNKNL